MEGADSMGVQHIASVFLYSVESKLSSSPIHLTFLASPSTPPSMPISFYELCPKPSCASNFESPEYPSIIQTSENVPIFQRNSCLKLHQKIADSLGQVGGHEDVFGGDTGHGGEGILQLYSEIVGYPPRKCVAIRC